MENSQTARTHLNMQIAAGALLTAAVLGIYAQSLGFDFIDLDDGVYVTQNPVVRAGLTAKGVAWAFQTLHGGFWIPLTWIFLMADQSLFGGGAWGFHLTNMLLHLANSLLVLWILSSLTKSFRLSLLSALIFAVHPLHVESVCWVSERKDVLFAFFFLFAVGAHGRYAHSRKRAWLAWTFCAGFFVFGGQANGCDAPFHFTDPGLLAFKSIFPGERPIPDCGKNPPGVNVPGIRAHHAVRPKPIPGRAKP